MKAKRASPAGISDLRFLGPVSERILAKAGIEDVSELRKLGSAAAYLRAKRVDPRVSLNLLWALEAALSGKHWREVARDERTSLLLAVESLQGPAPKRRGSKAWQVYVIECASGAWYTGITNDLQKRFRQHREGKGAKFMRMDKPQRIVAVRACGSRSQALKLEAALKAWPRKEKADWIRENPYM